MISVAVFEGCGGGGSSGRDRGSYVMIHKGTQWDKEPISESTAETFTEIFKSNFKILGKLGLSSPVRNEENQASSYTSFWSFLREPNSDCAIVRYNMIFDTALPHGKLFFKNLSLIEQPEALNNIDLRKISEPHWTDKSDDIDYFADALGIGKPNNYAYIESECCDDCVQFDAHLKDRNSPRFNEYFIMSPKDLVWNLRDALRSGFVKTKQTTDGISFELPQEIQSRLRLILERDFPKLKESGKKEIKSKLAMDKNTRQFFFIKMDDESSCPIIEFSVIPTPTITRGSKRYEWLGEKTHFLFTENPQWDSVPWSFGTEYLFGLIWTYSECDKGRGVLVWPDHEGHN